MNAITENFRKVRDDLEAVLEKREFNELPEEVRERAYKALGNLSRTIQLMMFKYNTVGGKMVDGGGKMEDGKSQNKQIESGFVKNYAGIKGEGNDK